MLDSRETRSSARRGLTWLVVALACAALVGCTGVPEYAESRPLLGTTVTVTTYGEDQAALEAAADDAFAAMEEVAGVLDAYDPESEVASFNSDPFERHEVSEVLGEALITVVGRDEWYSPGLWGVMNLYEFDAGGSVPEQDVLAKSVTIAAQMAFSPEDGTVQFPASFDSPTGAGETYAAPGLDLGGVAKGLALDYGIEVFEEAGVAGALISAGSSTVVTGSKPDGVRWTIGIEDPRDIGRIVATVEVEPGLGPVSISTSGDYQQYFEVDGVRYHHILDPLTGRPARGVRSVTVIRYGTTGAIADVLSTALFVAGPEEAVRYAEDHGFGLYLVDDEGRAHVVPGPDDAPFSIEEVVEPLPE